MKKGWNSSVWLHLCSTFLGQTEGFEASRGQFLSFYESKVEDEPKEGPQEGPKTAQEPPRGPKVIKTFFFDASEARTHVNTVCFEDPL